MQVLNILPFQLHMTTMDFFSHLLAIIALLGLVVLCSFKRIRPNSAKNSKSIGAPEPSGAWPIIGHLHLLGGELPVARTLGALADKYGAIYSLRLGSCPALVVSSWEAVKECFTTNDTIFATRPSMAVGKYMGYDYAVFALAPYGPYWRDMRKMVALELMTKHRLEQLKHVRASEVDSFIKDLHLLCVKNRDFPTKVVINKWFEHLTFNIIVRMLAGKRFAADESNSEDLDFKQAIKKALYLGGVFVVSDNIPWLEWVDIGGHVKAMKETSKELDAVFERWLQEHIQDRKQCKSSGERDFMDLMLSTLAEDTGASSYKRGTIIKATVLILIMTGSESTAETLIWGLSLLMNNRHMLKKAQDELDIHVGRDKWVEESDIQNLTYLQAIIKETFRLYPPGPLSGPREAMEDCYINGYHVPKGTRLIVNLWKLQRDPRIWSNPSEFQPERFLTTHANVRVRGQDFEYIPFSSGRRMCPGVTFGWQVVQLTLARFLQGFDITTPMNMPVDMTEGAGIALPKLSPLEVVLKPRLPLELYQKLRTNSITLECVYGS
ncbi:xanthotoxin 5-hydroxylase CYP82C4-like [Cornus florida]|uniref:xanthotoxin 5-hydroxylase CYP82C4-like n=1 Tax=Cornus florida TaxID=4283 RepID=UPI002896858B|nr:xanthotoxin 5-hydroxylase CYP82C4-like [Cornus florida]